MSSGMAAQAFGPTPGVPLPPVATPRPQVGIERLPARRLGNEPRESMNCKSCRKRKIKCNRLRPACEACQVFQCPCVYDAVPKKRGPKTDVLEALLKRVDGLEQRLREQKAEPRTPTNEKRATLSTDEPQADSSTSDAKGEPSVDSSQDGRDRAVSAAPSASSTLDKSWGADPHALLDTYFARFHGKPFYILDESTLRQRLQLGQVPNYLIHAIYAIAAKYHTQSPGGYQDTVKASESYALRARNEIDIDEPSIDALQALLLLVTAFTAAGRGKKAYMLLASAVGMAMALELHREMDPNARVTVVEREVRRRLFWTCYVLDRFTACGSKRPSLIGDKTILLRLPCWSPGSGGLPIEGDFFQSGPNNLQFLRGSGGRSRGSGAMLVDISRILGTTNRYLAAGGVKGDSHFPWHSLSNLSRIRQDLDAWASGMEDVFSSVDALFGQPDSTVLVLGKLIYHLIHCLVYRPFLPIHLSELAGSGQHQSWQIEATNMCFLHANAIAELVELGRQTAAVEWPAFVGYCICAAGTVHIHGAHYGRDGGRGGGASDSGGGGGGEMSVFASSPEFLSRAMQQLGELRHAWASVQRQRDTLQAVYNAHSELVKRLASSPVRYSPVSHLEDFFDRYSDIGGPDDPPIGSDTANISLSDVVVDFAADTVAASCAGRDLDSPRPNGAPSFAAARSERPSLKRKNTAPSGRAPQLDLRSAGPPSGAPYDAPASHECLPMTAPPHLNRPPFPASLATTTNTSVQPSAGFLPTPTSPSRTHHHENTHTLLHNQHVDGFHDTANENDAAVAAAAAAAATTATAAGEGDFALTSDHAAAAVPQDRSIPSHLPNVPFDSPFHFSQLPNVPPPPPPPGNDLHGGQAAFDPMFGGVVSASAFSSPAPWHGGGGSGGGLGGGEEEERGGAVGDGKPAVGPSPEAGSRNGGGPGEEKDPFLSLLEQLAENESLKGYQGSELDFFLAGASNTD